MSCFLEEQAGETIAVLSFKREQLLYDIKNYAHIEGSVMPTEDAHNRHMVQDVGEEGNVDRMTRVLDLKVKTCKELLYPYTKREIHRAVLDDKLREPGTYGIVMRVPSGYSQTTLNLLESLIHEYLVCECVADWMSITHPEKKPAWDERAEKAKSEMRSCLMARMKRVRRRGHPF